MLDAGARHRAGRESVAFDHNGDLRHVGVDIGGKAEIQQVAARLAAALDVVGLDGELAVATVEAETVPCVVTVCCACAITPLASSSSSSPCRSSSASQSVQNPGPDAIRAGSSASGIALSSPACAGGMDEGMTAMANWAGNKAPGERKWSRQPRSYQELCSISGAAGSRHATAINMPPDRDRIPKPGHSHP